jgi:hypothetical protein
MAITVEGELPPGMVGDYYEARLAAQGGTGPYQWAVVDYGVLPSGLRLNGQNGVIAGIPDSSSQAIVSFTVQVTDARLSTARRDCSIRINPALKISRSVELPSGVADPDYIAGLSAAGGAPPYRWELARGTRLPTALVLNPDSGRIRGTPTTTGTTAFTVQVVDAAPQHHTDAADFSVRIRRVALWRSPRKWRRREIGFPKVARLTMTVRPRLSWGNPLKRRWSVENWLSLLALALPAFGAVWIGIYAFSTDGPHSTYLGVGMLTGLASFLGGCLVGFLFGIPRVVSSGDLRRGTSGYAPSSNLAEVSDWLTKVLLGAGLVQITRLGKPISGLIDNVAGGLHTAGVASGLGPAKVMAGVIVLGYAVIGLLDGFVVTTVWYQKKIASLNQAPTDRSP